MPGTFDLGIAIARGCGAVVAGGVNPNLLLWTEQIDNAVWATVGAATVTANNTSDPLGNLTADRITSPALGDGKAQTSGVAAASGAAVEDSFALTSAWERCSVTGIFDAALYTFSIWLKVTGGGSVKLRLDRSGGFLRCSMLDEDDGMFWFPWGAKLETGGSPTGNALTYGTRTT